MTNMMVDLCTQSVTDDLMERARRSLETATVFTQRVLEISEPKDDDKNKQTGASTE